MTCSLNSLKMVSKEAWQCGLKLAVWSEGSAELMSEGKSGSFFYYSNDALCAATTAPSLAPRLAAPSVLAPLPPAA